MSEAPKDKPGGEQLKLSGIPPAEVSPFFTDNPREIRIIRALAAGPCSRSDIDEIAGATNGPAAIAELRERGLSIPCERSPARDLDSEIVFRGIYEFSESDLARTRHIWEIKQ